MTREKLEVKMRMRYVDDIRILMNAIKEGWRWENNRMIFRKCWQLEELKEEMSHHITGDEEDNGQHFHYEFDI